MMLALLHERWVLAHPFAWYSTMALPRTALASLFPVLSLHACPLPASMQYAKIIQKVGYHSARFTEFKIQVSAHLCSAWPCYVLHTCLSHLTAQPDFL